MSNLLNIPRHTNCTNCGECCGIIPATEKEINVIREYIAENNVKPVGRTGIEVCPFRDNEQKKCLIYPVRPVICRLFGVTEGSMQCLNGNSAEIDGTKFIQKGNVKTLNFEKW